MKMKEFGPRGWVGVFGGDLTGGGGGVWGGCGSRITGTPFGSANDIISF